MCSICSCVNHNITSSHDLHVPVPGNAPLTAVQLLWVNMIMDTLGALALATEPPDDSLMKKAPVGRTGKFITNVMWRNIVGQSLFQFVVIWYLQTQGKYLFGLEGSDADNVLNTIIFNTFVFCQVSQLLGNPHLFHRTQFQRLEDAEKSNDFVHFPWLNILKYRTRNRSKIELERHSDTDVGTSRVCFQ